MATNSEQPHMSVPRVARVRGQFEDLSCLQISQLLLDNMRLTISERALLDELLISRNDQQPKLVDVSATSSITTQNNPQHHSATSEPIPWSNLCHLSDLLPDEICNGLSPQQAGKALQSINSNSTQLRRSYSKVKKRKSQPQR